jgi:hypothetical protein
MMTRSRTRAMSITVQYTEPVGVITRSKSASTLTNKHVEFDVDIDFDKASHEWRKNKQYRGNGSFMYKKFRL